MKRPRPYIPLAVRVEVAERDVPKGAWWELYSLAVERGRLTLGKRLMILLGHLPKGAQLDHDPALILRPYVDGFYSPLANDPAYLVYREKAEHQQKTTGRKPGAERTITTKGSDIGLKAKFAKLEKRTKASRRPKHKIPSRPFPKNTRGFR